jgi:hypothetical protein
VFALGGYRAVGAASVAVCLLAALTATRFPEDRNRKDDDEGWAATLRTGLATARTDRSLRGALLLVPAVACVWSALDEYSPLLVRETGVPDGFVPYALLLIWAAVTAVSLLAGPAERLGTTGFTWLIAASAVALALGALARNPAGLALIAVAFAGFQLATVLADVRLQHRIEEGGRATLTSVAGLGTELLTVLVYGAYAVAGDHASHGAVFALFALPYLVGAVIRGAAAKARR